MVGVLGPAYTSYWVPYRATKTHARNLASLSVVTRQYTWIAAATLKSWSSARMVMETCGIVEPIEDKN